MPLEALLLLMPPRRIYDAQALSMLPQGRVRGETKTVTCKSQISNRRKELSVHPLSTIFKLWNINLVMRGGGYLVSAICIKNKKNMLGLS